MLDSDEPDSLINTTVADPAVVPADTSDATTLSPEPIETTTAADVTTPPAPPIETTTANITTSPVTEQDTTTLTTTPAVTTAPPTPDVTTPAITTPAATTPADTTVSAPAVQHTVIFADRAGNVLSVQLVSHGSDAIAPDVPIYEGYEFEGWDKSLSAVTKDTTFTAQYKAVRNQLFIQCTTNADGSLTYTLSATGHVNFYGMELKLTASPAGVTYVNSATLSDGGAINYTSDNYLIFSYIQPQGSNVTDKIPLFSFTVRYSGRAQDVSLRIYDVDIFDENFVNERYSVSRIKYN